MNKRAIYKHGYAVLELLFYIAFFSILSLVVVNAMIIMAQSFRESERQTQLLRSGEILERISREIRQAESIYSISSNSLTLNTTAETGIPKTVGFLLAGSNIELRENDALTGNMNTPDITVSELTFTEITTAEGKAVRVIVTTRARNDTYGRTAEFHDTVVLRGSY